MKILLYNWASLDTNDGGGVNVYVKNLIDGLLKRGYDISFLNSGVRYTKDLKPRIIELPKYHSFCRRFEIINSPVLAPAHSMFYDLNKAIENKQLKKIFINFCRENNFDIIHFNNIEGLSLDILDTKNSLQSTKFIYTIHNYHCVCPQVNLWKNEYENCINNNNFTDCTNCVYTDNIDNEIKRRITPPHTTKQIFIHNSK